MDNFFTILEKRVLTPSAFVLRFERKHIEFKAGQYLSVGLAGEPQARDYSVYSAENDPYVEIMVKQIDNGTVSRQLSQCKKGDRLRILGPRGNFNLHKEVIGSRKHLFIATGTGISPFHSFVKSNPALNYLLIHGVRKDEEAYERNDYDTSRYVLCCSREETGDYHGRVTGYLKTLPVEKNSVAYLCGNGDMIFEVFEILVNKGIGVENIHTEIYF